MKKQRRLTRRAALKAGAAGGVLGALTRTSFAAGPSWMNSSSDKLLTIFLRGGYDATNSFIPDGDPAYNATNRPSLYIPTNRSFPIQGSTFTRLNPALKPLSPLLDSGRAIVAHAVGNPARTGSHFEDQRTWETSVTGCTTTSTDPEEGWITRLVSDVFPAGGFQAASVSNGLQQLFRTRIRNGSFNPARVIPHIKSVRDFPNDATALYSLDTAFGTLDTKLRGTTSGAFPHGLRALYNGGSQPTHDKDAFARAVGEAMLESEAQVSNLPGTYAPAGGARYPFGHPTNPDFPMPTSIGLLSDSGNVRRFFMYLRDAMMMLRSLPDVKVIGIEIGGWDTHANQGSIAANGNPQGQLAELLQAVAWGVAQVDAEIQAGAFGSTCLTTMVVSEFGRTSDENSTGGTDHGGATSVWLAGPRVKQNGSNPIYNDGTRWPGLYSANNQDFGCNPVSTPNKTFVDMRTDFRAIFAEVLRDLFAANPTQIDSIIPGYSALGLTELNCIG